jgi:predicted DNA-binding transcriptional regulator YafY
MQSGLNPRYMEERVVLFTYDGGHDPGTIRRAYVIRYSEGPNIDPYIDTYDFERREFRKFTTSKMTVISECEAKYIKDLPESLIGEFTPS